MQTITYALVLKHVWHAISLTECCKGHACTHDPWAAQPPAAQPPAAQLEAKAAVPSQAQLPWPPEKPPIQAGDKEVDAAPPNTPGTPIARQMPSCRHIQCIATPSIHRTVGTKKTQCDSYIGDIFPSASLAFSKLKSKKVFKVLTNAVLKPKWLRECRLRP